MSIVSLKNINKKFDNKVIFKDFNLEVDEGEFLCVTGVSGAGKSTLLNIIGMLEKPDSGTLEINGVTNPRFNSAKGIGLLRNTISYLFQNYGLIEEETVIYNLKVATHYLHYSKEKRNKKIAEALEKVGLMGYEKKKVYQLSGGEQQRVAMAKILLKPSKLVLADEPTGSLDGANRDEILGLLQEMNKSGRTIIVVTHDPQVDAYATKHLVIGSDNK